MKIVVYIHRSREGFYAAWTECGDNDTTWSDWCTTQAEAEAQAKESILGSIAPNTEWKFLRKQMPSPLFW